MRAFDFALAYYALAVGAGLIALGAYIAWESVGMLCVGLSGAGLFALALYLAWGSVGPLGFGIAAAGVWLIIGGIGLLGL